MVFGAWDDFWGKTPVCIQVNQKSLTFPAGAFN